MSAADQYQEGLESSTGALSSLSTNLSDAYKDFDSIEEEWDQHRDVIAEELKEQMVDDQRKGDPADHWVTSVARRRKPEMYAAWRKAKRRIEKLTVQSSNTRSQLTGFQSLLKTEQHLDGGQHDQSSRRGLPVHGQRRAA